MHGQELVVIALTPVGPREVARHALSTPGNPRIADEHYPPRPEGPLGRTPRATSPAEAEFLAGRRLRNGLVHASEQSHLGPGVTAPILETAHLIIDRVARGMSTAGPRHARVGADRDLGSECPTGS